MSHTCPLCGDNATAFHARDRRRPYYHCLRCAFVFVPSEFHLNEAEEKAHYDTHENNPADPRYRAFLTRLANPLIERLEPGSAGLDFGCGPGPTLSLMLEEQGHRVALYDRYYACNESVLAQSYDFVTATEVIEHLKTPGDVLSGLWHRISPGGWLALMTGFYDGQSDFANWFYKNDPTHIGFFCRETFVYLGKSWRSTPQFVTDNVVLFHKPPG